MKRVLIVPLLLGAVFAGGVAKVVQDQCGPFTDVTPAFCPYVLELYYLGITAGTSATTFSPDDPLTRGQGAVFIAKGLNQSLARSSRPAALGQWWTTTPQFALGLGVTPLGPSPFLCASDGTDVWAVSAVPETSGTVARVRASDGRLVETWTDALGAQGIVGAMGRIFVTSNTGGPNGQLYMIDPSQPAGLPTTVTMGLGPSPFGITFDGSRIWTADGPSVSIVTPAGSVPWPVTPASSGFQLALGALFDGTNVWVTDYAAGTLLRLDSNGAVLQTVTVGTHPEHPTFDGANIWVPNFGDGSVSVVQASTGVVLTTLTGLPAGGPVAAAFDGRRVLVTTYGGSAVSLWNAADFAPLGTFSTGPASFPLGACSDGVNFWMTLSGPPAQLARF